MFVVATAVDDLFRLLVFLFLVLFGIYLLLSLICTTCVYIVSVWDVERAATLLLLLTVVVTVFVIVVLCESELHKFWRQPGRRRPRMSRKQRHRFQRRWVLDELEREPHYDCWSLGGR